MQIYKTRRYANPLPHRPARLLAGATVALAMLSLGLVTGCSSDSTAIDSNGTGGSAGDPDSGDDDVLAPFAGVWDITGNWNGQPDDEAVLAIGASDAAGTAPVTLYDYEGDAVGSGDNCYRPEILEGELEPSLDGRIFMSGIVQFEAAVVSLSPDASSMNIRFFDTLDINSNGDVDETIDYTATRIGLMEIDLPVCQ